MKAFVLLLAILAALKVGHQEYLFRSGAREIIVEAYRERALAACQRDARGQAVPASAAVWSKTADIRLAIGKPGLDVYFWQVDNALWSARYKNPYLYIQVEERTVRVVCEYDIVQAAATILRH